MINFIVMSSELWPHVLDTQAKIGADLSTAHYMVVCCIRWQGRMLNRPGQPKHMVCWEHLAEETDRSSTPTEF